MPVPDAQMSTYSLSGNAYYPIVEPASKTGMKLSNDKSSNWLKDKIAIKNLMK